MKTYKTNMDTFTIKKEKTDIPRAQIKNAETAAQYIRQFYCSDISVYESVFLLMLNRANNTTGYVKISQGGMSGTVVDPKIVAKYALDSMANGVILAHNHPSGNTAPSAEDDRITAKIKEGLKLLDIVLLDHIILTEDEFFSYADTGKI